MLYNNHVSEIIKGDTFPIFLFHGVVRDNDQQIRNYTKKHLYENDFENFLQLCLKIGGQACTLDDLIAAQQGRISLPQNAFFITFDDGFLNNLTVAAPILRKYEIPATFYITSDFVDRNRMSWIDRIEYAIEQTDIVHLTDFPLMQKPATTKQEKINLLDQIRTYVKSNTSIGPDDFATRLQLNLLHKEVWSNDHPLDQKLTWNQVNELSKIPGMSIGGHTHNHAMMSHLNDVDLEYEIDHCLQLLKSKADITTIHFSYPEGQETHYDQRCIDRLKAHNVQCSPTAIEGVNQLTTDLFHLKRISIT